MARVASITCSLPTLKMSTNQNTIRQVREEIKACACFYLLPFPLQSNVGRLLFYAELTAVSSTPEFIKEWIHAVLRPP